jgi:hypothetical protein
MNFLIRLSFNSLKPSDLLAQAETIITSMTANAGFPQPWPTTVPTLTQIQTDLAAFQSMVTATAAGDKTQIQARNAAGQTLATDLSELGFYVQSVAKDDTALLASTGFPLRQQSPRPRVTDTPAAPDRLRLARGNASGSLVVRASPLPRAGSYDVQITTGDPTVEANWVAAGSYRNCGRIELTGLTPLKTYSVRMRALGAAGPGAWTTPVSLVVL